MTKAFDLVDHELILLKLDLFGCRENDLAWFHSYLGERYQCVKYDSVLSDPLPVKIGVPHLGSILGPLLFIIFMNDSILEISDIRFNMYADYSTLNQSLTTNSKPLCDWIDANCMVLNADKTECMLLGTRQKLRCANAKLCSKLRSRMFLFNQVKRLLPLHAVVYCDSNV